MHYRTAHGIMCNNYSREKNGCHSLDECLCRMQKSFKITSGYLRQWHISKQRHSPRLSDHYWLWGPDTLFHSHFLHIVPWVTLAMTLHWLKLSKIKSAMQSRPKLAICPSRGTPVLFSGLYPHKRHSGIAKQSRDCGIAPRARWPPLCSHTFLMHAVNQS